MNELSVITRLLDSNLSIQYPYTILPIIYVTKHKRNQLRRNSLKSRNFSVGKKSKKSKLKKEANKIK